MLHAHIPQLKTPFADRARPVLWPVGDDDLAGLQKILNHSNSADPYQASAGYFAMTGRDGLWLVKEGDVAVIICRHPNVDDTFLVFPPIGSNGAGLLAKTISAIAKTGVKVSLARADEKTANHMIAGHPAIELMHMPESVLDWAYPVHVLDTAKVTAHKGNEYQQFRTKLNKIDPLRIKAIDLNPRHHRQAVGDIVAQWCDGEEDKAAPYIRLLDLYAKVRGIAFGV